MKLHCRVSDTETSLVTTSTAGHQVYWLTLQSLAHDKNKKQKYVHWVKRGQELQPLFSNDHQLGKKADRWPASAVLFLPFLSSTDWRAPGACPIPRPCTALLCLDAKVRETELASNSDKKTKLWVLKWISEAQSLQGEEIILKPPRPQGPPTVWKGILSLAGSGESRPPEKKGLRRRTGLPGTYGIFRKGSGRKDSKHIKYWQYQWKTSTVKHPKDLRLLIGLWLK